MSTAALIPAPAQYVGGLAPIAEQARESRRAERG